MNPKLLESRLIDFAALIIEVTKDLTSEIASIYFAKQLVRSGSSPALNYGEAQSAESQKDFIHKMGISAKELRETYVSLRIIERANLAKNQQLLNKALIQNNELIAIFVSSIKTAESRLHNVKRKP